jgi:hypothetical protein
VPLLGIGQGATSGKIIIRIVTSPTVVAWTVEAFNLAGRLEDMRDTLFSRTCFWIYPIHCLQSLFYKNFLLEYEPLPSLPGSHVKKEIKLSSPQVAHGKGATAAHSMILLLGYF